MASIQAFAQAQTQIITVLDAETGKPLARANAQYLDRNENNKPAVETDPSGIVKISARAGDRILISHVAYQDTVLVVKSDRSNYSIGLKHLELNQVVIFADEPFNRKAAQGRQDVPMEFLTAVPSMMGEPDIMKSITFLPGVSEGNEGYSHIFVRGGDQDQNQILFDGATLFNVNHFGGFMSMFHAEMISSVDFYKNYWPSKYGGRLSSVMDIRTAEGNYKEHKQSFDLSLIVPKFNASGPLWKDKVSYSIGARRTIVDLITGSITRQIKNGKKSGDMASFLSQDFNVRIDGRIKDSQHLSISALSGRDNYSYFQNELTFGDLEESYYRIKNKVIALNYRWHPSTSTTLNGHASYSGYLHFFENDQIQGKNSYSSDRTMTYRHSGNMINALKFNLYGSSRVNDRWELNYGLEHEVLDYSLYLNRSNESENGGVASVLESFSGSINRDNASSTSVFTDVRYQVNNRLHFNTGLRLSRYEFESFNVVLPEPKLLATYELNKKSTINAAFNLQRQTTVLLGFADEDGYFREFYTTADERVFPSYSRQWSVGYFRTFDRWIDNLSFELFYKDQRDISKYLPSTDEDKAVLDYYQYLHTEGKNRTYGAELLLQKTVGSFHGSLAYTYSHSRSSFESLNNGHFFDADFDSRHTINLLLIYRFGKGYELSGQWVYKTGRPFTIPNSQSQENDFAGSFPIINEINNFRLPAFHRLDLSLDRKWLSKRGNKNWFGIGVYNAYNRVNPFFVRPDDRPNMLKVHGMFPIIPSFHIGFEL